MDMRWTSEQQKVIDLRERNILVSAAAGSGKTAVLVERIIRMLTDPEKPVDVDRLLIVTFTEAAAAEMKERIRGAIEQGNGRHLLDAVLETMATCGSLEWTQKRAEEEADKAIAALQILPDTRWREALIGLAHIAVQRDH